MTITNTKLVQKVTRDIKMQNSLLDSSWAELRESNAMHNCAAVQLYNMHMFSEQFSFSYYWALAFFQVVDLEQSEKVQQSWVELQAGLGKR